MAREYDNLEIEYGRCLDAICAMEELAARTRRYIDDYERNEHYLRSIQCAIDDVAGARKCISDAVLEFAIDDVWTQARENEEVVYEAVRAAAASAGAELTGTEYRLKTRDSLSRKIAKEAASDMGAAAVGRRLVWGEVAGSVGDALRFTMLLPFVGFVDAYRRAESALSGAGFKFTGVRNTFANENSSYRGINTNIVHDATNYRFEVQFHTAKSFNVKENEAHAYYEVTRDPKNDGTPEYAESMEKQRELFDSIPIPDGVEEIESF